MSGSLSAVEILQHHSGFRTSDRPIMPIIKAIWDSPGEIDSALGDLYEAIICARELNDCAHVENEFCASLIELYLKITARENPGEFSGDLLYVLSRVRALYIFLVRKLRGVSPDAQYTMIVGSLLKFPPRDKEKYSFLCPILEEVYSSANERDRDIGELLKSLSPI